MDSAPPPRPTVDTAAPQQAGTMRMTIRMALGLISAALMIIGASFLRTGFRLREQCRAAEAAQVLNVSIDIGAAGQHRATLKQTAAFPCRQYIRIEPTLSDGEDPAAALRGLELTITVQDAEGTEHMTGAFPAPFIEHAGNGVTLVDARPMPLGDYTVLIDIVSPAPSLAGHPVRIVSRYQLCGIEWMPPTVGIGGGVLSAALGTLIGASLWATRRR